MLLCQEIPNLHGAFKSSLLLDYWESTCGLFTGSLIGVFMVALFKLRIRQYNAKKARTSLKKRYQLPC